MANISEKKPDSEKYRLLNIRKNLRQKIPSFRRIESWRLKRIKKSWRRPRGIDSKAREKKKGWPIIPMAGFRSPKEIRYKTRSGKEEILVFSAADLSLIDPTSQVVRIASNIGQRKKERIIMEAELQNVRIINPVVAKVKVDLGDLETELDLDEELLEDISIDDLELDEDNKGEEE